MSMPMSDINKGGNNPAVFGSGYPHPTSDGTIGTGYAPSYGFQGSPQGGYVPPQPEGGYVPAQPQGGYVPPSGYAPVSQQPYGGGGPMQQYEQYGGQPMAYGGPQQPYGGPQGGVHPITQQPGPDGWMPVPTGIPNCPRGLEYLTTIDQLLVKQKVELLEAFTGFETNNKFSVKNSLGQKVYFAVEDNDCCTRNCLGASRPFDMKVFDNYKNEVIHMYRKFRCSACCFPCCLQEMEVTSPPGSVVGTIEQIWSLCIPQFNIKNHLGDVVLRIEGPFCTLSMCGDVEFKVLSLAGEEVGKISKQWSGFAREMFTDSDFFGISFPIDLDVKIKAVLLGACFLIDAMYFERSGNKQGSSSM